MRYAKLVVIGVLGLGGCTTASPPLTAPTALPAPMLVPASIRSAPPGDLSLTAAEAGPGVRRGAVVRWGGSILALQNEPGWTRIEVQQHPLDQNGQPQPGSGSAGRFYVRAAIPFDSQVYATGRQITVAGVLTGTAASDGPGPRSDLPVVEAKDIYFWGSTAAQSDEAWFRPRRQRDAYSKREFYNPFDFLPGLSFGLGLGFGHWNGWRGYYPGYWGGWRGWSGWSGYYPGYWWPRSGIYFRIYR